MHHRLKHIVLLAAAVLLFAGHFAVEAPDSLASPNVYSLAIGPDGLYVAGRFLVDSVDTATVMRWSDGDWHLVETPPGINVDFLARAGESMYVAGFFGNTAYQIYRSGPFGWELVGESIQWCCETVEILALRSIGDESIAVGGTFTNIDGIEVQALAVHSAAGWDSLGGQVVGFPSFENSQDNVFDILPVGDSVVVSGSFRSVGSSLSQRVALWNGAAWESLGEGLGTAHQWNQVNALAWYKDTLFAGGRFDSSGTSAIGSLARWTGQSWESALDSLDSSSISSLATGADGLLYVGGLFGDSSSGIRNIASFDGSVWRSLGRGINGPVTSIVVDSSGDVFAGGRFDSAGTEVVNSIARWDGASWFALDDGLVVSTKSDVEPDEQVSVAVFPNPFESTLTISIAGQRESRLQVTLFDALGRVVRRVSFIDSQTTIDLSTMPNGLYLLKVDGVGVRHVSSIVKVAL